MKGKAAACGRRGVGLANISKALLAEGVGPLAREGMMGWDGIFASEGTAKIVTAVGGDDRQLAQRAFGTISLFGRGFKRKAPPTTE